MHRRHLLATLPLASLAACGITTNGGVTTGTLDVDRIVTDGGAILAACQATLLAPAVATLIGPNYAVAQAALVAGQAALAEIRAVAGPSVTVSVDTTKVQALVTSLLADAQQVLTLVQGVLAKLSGAAVAQVQNYVAAALALIPLVQVAASLASVRATMPTMTEAQALHIANGG